MRARWILPLLLALSLVFVITLVLLVVTEQKSKITFNEGLVTFEKPTLRVSQTSQAKEKAINEPVRVDSQGTTEPEPDSSGKNSGKILADYEKYLNTTYLWGTYKPHLIHTFTQRLTKPLTFGFMFVATESNSRLYHTYDEVKSSNGAVFTEYLNHNGKNYSKSIFQSRGLQMDLYNYFYKEKMLENRQRWHSITTKDKSGAGYLNNKISVIYYFIIEDFDGLPDDRYLEFNEEQGTIQVKKPGSDPLEYFKIVVYDNTNKAVDFKTQKKSVYVNNGIDKRNTWKLEDVIADQMQVDPDVKFKMLPNNFNSQNERTNLIAVQLALDQYASFTVHIVHDHWDEFKDVKDNHNNVKRIINRNETHFSPEYNKVFAQIDDQSHRSCALSAFSNLLSGIGYFYGNIEVEDRIIQPNLPLYTGTPSKSGFPRGFLWDEGFHGLIYCTWNTDICIDILQHWMGTQVDGWIPREQMRGEECKSKGNPNYMLQKRNEANPPTLMFLVTALIEAHDKGQLSEGAAEMLKGLYPKLKEWFNWFVTSQASGGDGDDKNKNDQGLLYIWKANDAKAGLVLGSGLDDYPRGLTGGAQPRGHLDLQLWIVFMAENLVKLAEFAEAESDLDYLNSLSSKISSELTKFLDSKDHIYKDLIFKFGKEEYSPHFGYVNLFPLFFGLLKDNSVELDTLLNSLRSDSKIWSNFGLLSLSKEDDLYMKTTDSYWGGPIWIPINYLVLRGLKRYYSHNEKAMKIYSELRNNVVTNVCNQKFTKNYFFEQYNQNNGEGQQRFPFTGWTASVLLMMYEKY